MSIIRKDGTEVPIELTGAFTTYHGERANVVYIRDISDRKLAQSRLQETSEKLQLILNSVTDGIVVTDLNGIITEVNPKVLEMHGFTSRDEIIGRSAFEAYS